MNLESKASGITFDSLLSVLEWIREITILQFVETNSKASYVYDERFLNMSISGEPILLRLFDLSAGPVAECLDYCDGKALSSFLSAGLASKQDRDKCFKAVCTALAHQVARVVQILQENDDCHTMTQFLGDYFQPRLSAVTAADAADDLNVRVKSISELCAVLDYCWIGPLTCPEGQLEWPFGCGVFRFRIDRHHGHFDTKIVTPTWNPKLLHFADIIYNRGRDFHAIAFQPDFEFDSCIGRIVFTNPEQQGGFEATEKYCGNDGLIYGMRYRENQILVLTTALQQWHRHHDMIKASRFSRMYKEQRERYTYCDWSMDEGMIPDDYLDTFAEL